jgi:hypothetical protein
VRFGVRALAACRLAWLRTDVCDELGRLALQNQEAISDPLVPGRWFDVVLVSKAPGVRVLGRPLSRDAGGAGVTQVFMGKVGNRGQDGDEPICLDKRLTAVPVASVTERLSSNGPRRRARRDGNASLRRCHLSKTLKWGRSPPLTRTDMGKAVVGQRLLRSSSGGSTCGCVRPQGIMQEPGLTAGVARLGGLHLRVVALLRSCKPPSHPSAPGERRGGSDLRH